MQPRNQGKAQTPRAAVEELGEKNKSKGGSLETKAKITQALIGPITP